MSFIDSLTLYTASQKMVAYGFIGSGIVLLTTAALLLFVLPASSPLWQGFKIGSVCFGMVILLGGIGYLNFSGKIHSHIEADYQSSPKSALAAEEKRINKVVRDYRLYQIVFASIVFISLLAIIIYKPFWAGVAFSSAFLFVAVLLIEAHSKYSIDAHAQTIKELSKNLPHADK